MNSKSSYREMTLSRGKYCLDLCLNYRLDLQRSNALTLTELQQRIDVAGMMSVMRYSGGYHPSQPIMHWLWEVVDEMTPEQQRKFLRFMTSCSRQPLLGFNSLVPVSHYCGGILQ